MAKRAKKARRMKACEGFAIVSPAGVTLKLGFEGQTGAFVWLTRGEAYDHITASGKSGLRIARVRVTEVKGGK